jgi:hypothetical protein
MKKRVIRNIALLPDRILRVATVIDVRARIPCDYVSCVFYGGSGRFPTHRHQEVTLGGRRLTRNLFVPIVRADA